MAVSIGFGFGVTGRIKRRKNLQAVNNIEM